MRFTVFLLIIFAGAFTFCISCRDKSAGEQIADSRPIDRNEYYIDVENVDKVSFYDIFREIEIIPLETNISSLIGSIGKVQFDENKYYVLDKEIFSILVFSEDGSFINRIRKIGRGPGEYTLLEDFVVNPFTGELELLNPRGEILVVDDLGREIGNSKLPADYKSAHFIANYSNDTTILFSLFEDKQIVFFDRITDSIFSREYHTDEFIKGTQVISPNRSPFYFNNGNLFFFDAVNSIVYKVTKDKLVRDISFDFGNHQLKYESWPEDRALQFYVNYLLTSDYAYAFENFVRNDSLIIFRYIFDKVWHTVLLNERTGDIRIIKKFRELTVFPGLFDFFDQGIYAIVEPRNIQFIIREDYLDEKNKEIFNSVSLEDNPVIIKYYWK
ncbi:MAG: 6-bladed beta-propeller [Bacteroidales bacterium]|nr:6-bladed beta-propeller [Bacteroidales bacterium]